VEGSSQTFRTQLLSARIRADELIRPIYESAAASLPEGTEWFDAHTHVGQNDPDGFSAHAEDILASMDRAGQQHALVFPFQEPEGYPPANDRVIADAAASGGRLVALARLDPNADPLPEARRCLRAGARGFKLHPRGDAFQMSHPEVDGIFALADEHAAPVMIHAGRGIPSLGRDTVELARRYPGARPILAHAAISELGWIWREARELPNLFIDTSWWGQPDLLTLFAMVPPGQLLYASDSPYGSGIGSGTMMLRAALSVGVDREALGLVAGGQTARLAAGEEPVDAGAAPGADRLRRYLHAERVTAYLHGAIHRAFMLGDPSEPLALARLACDVPDEVAEAPVLRVVAQLIEEAETFRAAAPDEPRAILMTAMPAATLAGTPNVPVPELDLRAAAA
jgi:predicted TIM-barrel fold metal-dependent hydrolase